MKNILFFVIGVFSSLSLLSQNSIHIKEESIPLSKTDSKGFLYDSYLKDDYLTVLFKTPLKKKSSDVIYESYNFDKNLSFKNNSNLSVPKEEYQPEKNRSSIHAFVGGYTSFDILSMKLKIEFSTWKEEWDSKNQKYVLTKGSLKTEKIKPKKDLDRYFGHASFYKSSDLNNKALLLVSHRPGNRREGSLFSLLKVDSDGNIQDIEITSEPGYHLVKTGQLKGDQIFVIMAPREGNKYLFAQYEFDGKEIHRQIFEAPSPNLLITDFAQEDDELFFFGISKNQKDSYSKVFEDYAPIFRRGFSNSANYQQDKYEKKMYGVTAESFHFLKFKEGKLIWNSDTAVKDLAASVKTTPSQKKAKPYKGDRFAVQEFFVAPNQDLLIIGQTTKRKNIKTFNDGFFGEYTPMRVYMEVIAFHFDKNGKLKAQYAIDQLIKDKASATTPLKHRFFTSADNKILYWEMLEVKFVKGYSNFGNALLNIQTFYPNFFPRVGQIDLEKAQIYDFAHIGGKKKCFLMGKEEFLFHWNDAEKVRYYVGHDGKNKNLVVAKMKFQ